MKECISREAALAALKTYNKEPFHILHALTVEGVMRWYANELGYGEDADFWASRRRSCWKRQGAATSSSTPSAPTATASCATWSPPTRWRRCCLPPTS